MAEVKKREGFLPFALPDIGEEEIAEVVDTLRSNWITTGPKTKKFEKEFADYIGVKHAIAVNSCTAGLHLSLEVLNLKPDDEVIVPSFTFCATANVIVHAGAKPIFADIDPVSLCIDPVSVEKLITPNTKAMMIVHYGGRPADMDRLTEIANKHNITIIEDAAHAVYTQYKGKLIGSHGNLTSFSFYATKNIATAEGGMITTNDDELADKLRVLSLHGMSKNAWNRYSATGSWKYDVIEAGFKYNMTDIQASLGLHQLAKLEKMQDRRKHITQLYFNGLKGVKGITLPDMATLNPDDVHACHLFPIRIDKKEFGYSRDEMMELMKEYNIGVSVHFIPVHMHPYYRERYTKDLVLSVTEQVFDQIMSLPLYPTLSDEDALYVIDTIKYLHNKA